MAKKREARQRLLREKRNKLRNRIKTTTYILVLSTLLLILLYYSNPEVPIGGIPGVEKLELPGHSISYENILLKAILYKIVMENTSWAEGARVGVTLLVSNETLSYGTYSWSPETRILYVKESRVATLDASKKHTVYFTDNLTGATIPVAIVDTKYKSSFDSLVNYPPFQLHFVFYPDKCRPKISIETNREARILVKLYKEESDEIEYRSFTCSPPTCEYKADGCYTSIEVGFEPTLWSLVKLRVLGDNYYLLPGRSKILLLVLLPPSILLVRDTAKYKRLVRE